MRLSPLPAVAGVCLALTALTATVSQSAPSGRVNGWLSWRGPQQSGVSAETGLPDTWAPGGANDLWHLDIAGGGTPVIANGRVYVLGYQGSGPDLQEVLLCADAETGKKLWEKRFSDFLSDIIYDRYAIASPSVDPETGNVYAITAAGIFSCHTADGKLVWQHPMMDEFGRLTFPNGRNGTPLIDGDLVIMHAITSNWGGEGPALDRFYAFDKKTGQIVWSSSPGERPKDNSFSMPWLAWRNGQRVLYTGDGSGNVVCLNVRTGQPIWRFPLSAGGINASVVVHKDKVIAIHADENLDNSEIGRQAAINLAAQPQVPSEGGTPVLPPTAEVWRNHLEAISSSPVLVGDRIYQTVKTGSLCAVDANTGKVLWEHKLGPDQLHASPLYADGKLYVPIQNGLFFIVKPSDTGVQELTKVQLAGRLIGAPAVWNGKVYVHSTERLYCFGRKGGDAGKLPAWPAAPVLKAGKPTALQVIPAEVLLKPGETKRLTVRSIDANGFPVATVDPAKATWAKYIPPTARVRAEMSGSFNGKGELVADAAPKPSAGAFQATLGELKGTFRGRILPAPPQQEDFEAYDLAEDNKTDSVKFAYPPLPWIGARLKWEVRDVNGNKVLAKTLDNPFFQRSTVFVGYPEAKNYTLEADLMSDGSRRTLSTVGLINQRYLFKLMGNSQQLEVSSNEERIKVNVPFSWQSKTWYRLKTRVDTNPDGTGVVRAKAWKKGDPEPAQWTIEVPHKQAHQQGSPGFFGFTPQSLYRVYVDNLSITPNS